MNVSANQLLFQSVVGLDAAVRLLKGQLQQGTCSRSYFLTGPDGIGKRTLALEFAKAITAPLDVLLLEPKEPVEGAEERKSQQIGIEEVRALATRVSLTPFEGPWKVAIVSEADRLTEEATHACLKLLEEPPARTIFVLTTQAPHRLPATVVSRCTVVRCAPQGVERVERYLQEKEGLPVEQARRLAGISGGRLGRALRFHRSDILASKNEQLDQLLSAQKKRALEVPLGKAPREEVLEALQWYAAWWRDLLVLSVGGKAEWVIHQDRLEDLNQLLASSFQLPAHQLLDRIDRTFWVREAVERNAGLRIALAALLS